MKVGTIESIKPVGTQAEMTLRVDNGIRVPADAKAVLVAQNLVSARYVQLTPAYESGPAMSDGAVIPIERTAVPVEWNEVKEQLTRLATELGPDKGMSTGSVGRFIDSAANAMDGNGEKLRQTLAQLSGVGRILADGSGNIVDTIANLQTFVTALRDSNEQIVQFQDRFATLTSVVDDSRSDLDAALKNLSDVVGETTRFINGTRDKTAEQIQRLANVTQTVADNRMSLENVLHIAPHSIANAVNMFDPRTGAASGVFVFNNLSNPDWFICGMIGALENVTAPRHRSCVRSTSAPRCELRHEQPAVSGQSVPDLQPAALHASIQRAEPHAGAGRGAAGPSARGVRVHGLERRRATAPGLWAAARAPPPARPAPPPRPGHRPCRTCCCRRRGRPCQAMFRLRHHRATGRHHDRDECRATCWRSARRVLTVTGCAFQGVNSLPLPGAVGRGSERALSRRTRQHRYVGVQFAGDDRRRRGRQRRQDDFARLEYVDLALNGSRRLACQCGGDRRADQLVGSMHVALDPPVGEAPNGRLKPGTIGPNSSSTYPSTEQTLSSVAAVVNGGGLGQIGDIIHNFSVALSGRQDAVRDLITRLDTFVGTLYQQRDNIIATIDELNRFSEEAGSQQEVLTRALNRIPPALDVLVRERPRITTALEELGRFSDTVSGLVNDTQADLVNNLQNLEPTLKALADVGPELDTAIAYIPTFPLTQNLIDRGVRGDYVNLFVTVDLTNARIKRGILLGTRLGQDRASLIPAPGDPGTTPTTRSSR